MRRHLTFSNAISLLALFVALGGTTYAAVKLKPNSVGSKQVRDDSLGGADVREADLGQVPSAASAGTAGTVDGLDPARLARRGLAFTVLIGANQAANPPGRFRCHHSDGVACDAYFQNQGGGYANAAFGRDDFGLVHLQGAVRYENFASEAVDPEPVFTLPTGMRPAALRSFASLRNGTAAARIEVEPDGDVVVATPYADGDWFTLDGIDFAAAP